MIRIFLCMLGTTLFQILCHADITKLPANDMKSLRDVSRFREVHATTNLPPTILALCTDSNGRLSEPGKKWEETDYITDAKLPRKRLIWAVTDGYFYVVHYEKGGYAHSFHIMVAKLKDGEGKPSFIWRGVGGRLESFKAFLDAAATKS